MTAGEGRNYSHEPMVKLDQVICGDALEELRQLDPQSAQVVVADPPYFNVLTEHDWDTQWPAVEQQ